MEEKKKERIYKSLMLILITVIITFILTSMMVYKAMTKDGFKYVTTADGQTIGLDATLASFRKVLEKEYLGEIDDNELIEGAIKGYIAGLNDPYTEYYTKEEMKKLMDTTNGNYVGIGIYMLLDKEKNAIVIIKPMEGSPAEKAGLLPGDVISKVDGEPYTLETITAISDKIKGKAGTKVNKLLSIQKEIALNLAAKDVRIQAPIPGKSTIGIELPNKVNSAVSFREVLSKLPEPSDKSLLAVGLGKDIMGTVKWAEINATPHLLIAGATGSGKSVCINCIIASILMRTKPDEVKLVMVDPKKVELSMYNGVPHLLTPVVTDPKKASIALKNIVVEMERRYQVFEDTKCKNISSYNKMCETNTDYVKMPYIVFIIDELADLMLVAAKDVEDSIMRITQMARAAGIHLIVATQRPSTDVITGVVKANIPSRISFAVSSSIDSRTILDQTGAEKLLGKGDMLFKPMGENVPIRIQGAYVSDEELQKIVDFTISQQKANYDHSITEERGGEGTDAGKYDDGYESKEEYDDPLYNDIVDFAMEFGKISASLIQRKYRIGYNRAARIVDLLEERGIIGPQNGSKPREVLVKKETNTEEE